MIENIKSTIRNIILFVVLIAITFFIIFKNYDIKQTIDMIGNANGLYVILAIISMSLYFLFESINNKCILNNLNRKISIFKALKFSIIGFFFSGITPASGGGQPMEVYYMSKDGIPSSYGTLSLLVQMIAFHTVTVLFAIIGAIINYKFMSKVVIILLIYGLITKLAILGIMVLCIISKRASKKVIDLIIKLLKIFHVKNIEEKEKSLRTIQEDYNNGAKFIRKNRTVYIRTLLIIVLQVICYYAVPYFIYRSFGLSEYNWFTIITLQAVLYCSVASVPLPGAVGVSEGTFLNIYSLIFGESLLASSMIINRAVSFYIFIVIGSIIVSTTTIKNINKKSNKLKNKY